MQSNPRHVAADVIDKYLRRYPVGTKVRWGRRKKAPDIDPEGTIMSMSWKELKTNGGGFELYIRWPINKTTNKYGTHIEYTKYMFDKYMAHTKPENVSKNKAPTTFNLSRDLHIKERDMSWTRFGSSIPYAVRMLRWVETEEWLSMMSNNNRISPPCIAPFDPPPAIPLFETYTRPPISIDMSKINFEDIHYDVLVSPTSPSDDLEFPEDYKFPDEFPFDW
jgi:hypothetical protein